MPPTQRGAAAAVVSSVTSVVNPTTLAPTLPTHVAGDILLCYTYCRSSTPTVATPSGWTQLANIAATNGRIALFGKIAVSASETAPSVVWSGLTTGNSGTPCQAQCAVFYGLNGVIASLVGVTGTTENGAASTTASASGTAITTVADNALVISLSCRLDDAGTWTPPAGFTMIGSGGTTSGADSGYAWSYVVQPTVGSVSPADYSLAGASSFASSGVLLSLKGAMLISLAASVAMTSALADKAERQLDASLTLTPAMSDVATFEEPLDAGITLTPDLVAQKESLSQLTPITISADLSLTGVLSIEQWLARSLAAGITLTPALVKEPSRLLAAGLVVTPVLADIATHYRTLAFGLTLTPGISPRYYGARSLSAGLVLSPAIVRKLAKTVSAGLVLTPTMAKSFKNFKTIPAGLTLTPALAFQKPTGVLTQKAIGAVLSLSPALGLSGVHPRAISASLGLSAGLGREISRLLAAGMPISAVLGALKRLPTPILLQTQLISVPGLQIDFPSASGPRITLDSGLVLLPRLFYTLPPEPSPPDWILDVIGINEPVIVVVGNQVSTTEIISAGFENGGIVDVDGGDGIESDAEILRTSVSKPTILGVQ